MKTSAFAIPLITALIKLMFPRDEFLNEILIVLQLIPNVLFHFTLLSQYDHIWFHFPVCPHKAVAGKYLNEVFMRHEYCFLIDVFWFDLDLVHVVIFIEIRFLMPKLVSQLLKENLRGKKKTFPTEFN